MQIRILMILTVLLLAATACQRDASDLTVIHNVTGYTLSDDQLISFGSLVFSEGKVVEISAGGSLKADTTSATAIDGAGKVLLPGLIDAHGHVMGLGYQSLDADVTGAGSLQEALQRVGEYGEQYPALTWIRGRGWNHTHWDINRFPTASELDRIINDRPVWLTSVDGHAGWANSKAMELAGITKETVDPAGGIIIRDKDGKPTGIFIDGAMRLIEEHLPERTYEEQQRALSKALELMRSHGLTSVHDAGIGLDTWRLYKSFADSGKLTGRIYGMISGAGATFDSLAADGPVTSYAGDRLVLRSVKLYSDGALGSRGAAMLRPYSDSPASRGLLFSSQEELFAMILKTASRGNRVVLNAFEQGKDSLGDSGLRHRIEHAQIVSPDDISRFRELSIIASMQPTHATSDMNMAEERVGPERIKGGYAWKKFMTQGTIVASGSDFPVEHVNPFFGLYAAITRQDYRGNPDGGWYPGQRMSRKEAFRSFTIDAAYAAHQEHVLGTLEPGKWADFILADQDIFEVPVGEIWKTEVLETWVAGERVYSVDE